MSQFRLLKFFVVFESSLGKLEGKRGGHARTLSHPHSESSPENVEIESESEEVTDPPTQPQVQDSHIVEDSQDFTFASAPKLIASNEKEPQSEEKTELGSQRPNSHEAIPISSDSCEESETTQFAIRRTVSRDLGGMSTLCGIKEPTTEGRKDAEEQWPSSMPPLPPLSRDEAAARWMEIAKKFQSEGTAAFNVKFPDPNVNSPGESQDRNITVPGGVKEHVKSLEKSQPSEKFTHYMNPSDGPRLYRFKTSNTDNETNTIKIQFPMPAESRPAQTEVTEEIQAPRHGSENVLAPRNEPKKPEDGGLPEEDTTVDGHQAPASHQTSEEKLEEPKRSRFSCARRTKAKAIAGAGLALLAAGAAHKMGVDMNTVGKGMQRLKNLVVTPPPPPPLPVEKSWLEKIWG